MQKIQGLIENVERVIVGKRAVIELAVVALLCRGHVLLEDVPGTGKTMLARALAPRGIRVVALHQAFVGGPDDFLAGLGVDFKCFVVIHYQGLDPAAWTQSSFSKVVMVWSFSRTWNFPGASMMTGLMSCSRRLPILWLQIIFLFL